MERLTAPQLRELEAFCREHPNMLLFLQLLEEFRGQKRALDEVRQYVEMFSDAEGTVADVDALVSDLKDILDGVGASR